MADLAAVEEVRRILENPATSAGLDLRQRQYGEHLLAVVLMEQALIHEHLDDGPGGLVRYGRAVELLEPLVKIRPELAKDLAAAWMHKGNALRSLGRLAEAIEAHERAIGIHEPLAKTRPELANDLAAAWMNKGNALDSLGRLAEAIEAYAQAIRIYEMMVPVRREHGLDLAKCYFNKGGTLLNAGRIEAARGTCEQAIALCLGLEKDDSRPLLKSILHSSRQLKLQIEQMASQMPRILPTGNPTMALLEQRRNIEYQQALAAWQALPLLKRWRTRKPQPPAQM